MKLSRPVIIVIVLVLCGAGAYLYYNNAPRKTGPPPPVANVLPKEFLLAQKEGKTTTSTKTGAAATTNQAITATFTGNGRDQLHVSAQNNTDKSVRLTLMPAEIYESGKNMVALLEECDRDIPAKSTVQIDLKTAAINSVAVSGTDTYKKSAVTVPKLDTLLQHRQLRPDMSRGAVQTAVLALAENPPLDTFVKFPRLHGTPPASDDFKVDTVDIISALELLSDIGSNDRNIGNDPQLKIEAMIDPASHDAAMRYYGIAPEMEWTYWKHELLEGDPSTRHYALYGIARYYPDVALQMLPKWARETRLQQIYRLSAVRAMGFTHRQEAIPILRQLEQEFGSDTDLSHSADRAEKYLSTQFTQPS